jgi:hypothetical protein
MNFRQQTLILVIAFIFFTSQACSISRSVSKSQEAEITKSTAVELWADSYSIAMGQCTVVHWRTTGGPVKINNIDVDANGDSKSCPTVTKEYELVVGEGPILKRIVIDVLPYGKPAKTGSSEENQVQSHPTLDFWADRTIIDRGECTILHWRATGGDVWIREQGYPPESEMEVCPSETQEFFAEVGDQLVVKSLIINVQSGGVQNSAAQPQQPATGNQNNQASNIPKPAFAIKDVQLSFESGAYTGAIAAITTNGAGKVDWRWEWKFGVACHGELVFSAAATKTAKCDMSPQDTGKMDFFLEIDNHRVHYGSVELPSANADLSITDLFADNMPQGNALVRITNRGPEPIEGLDVKLHCTALPEPLPGVIAPADPITIEIILMKINQSRGQTKEFDTTLDVDFDLFAYKINCRIDPGDGDPITSNNEYSEVLP